MTEIVDLQAWTEDDIVRPFHEWEQTRKTARLKRLQRRTKTELEQENAA